jgi:hypothetical protein
MRHVLGETPQACGYLGRLQSAKQTNGLRVDSSRGQDLQGRKFAHKRSCQPWRHRGIRAAFDLMMQLQRIAARTIFRDIGVSVSSFAMYLVIRWSKAVWNQLPSVQLVLCKSIPSWMHVSSRGQCNSPS